MWAIFGTPLLKFLRKSVHGAAFKCCISGDATNLVGYCFIKDSTIVQISMSPNTTTKDTVKLSQEGLDIFAGLARSTGGKVRVQKTKRCLLGFTWNPGVKLHLSNNNYHLSLKTQELYQPIERLPPLQALSILGVWISPYRTSHEQTRHLQQTTKTWDDCVRSGHIRKSYAWFYFQNTVKINWIPPHFHVNYIQSILLHQISGSMKIPKILRYIIEHTKRHIFRTIISYRTKRRITIRQKRVQTHTVHNESW